MRIQLEQIDLTRPWPTLRLRAGYHALRVLVRVGATPVGDVMARPVRQDRELPPRRLRRRIARKLGVAILNVLARHAAAAGPQKLVEASAGTPDALRAVTLTTVSRNVRVRLLERHLLLESGLPAPWPQLIDAARRAAPAFPLPPVTIAVCTRDRAEQLRRCVRHLLDTDYPQFEILVVDNSHDPAATREVCERLGVAYVREPRPGLSRARNAALAAAQNRWIAFTDDDCYPETNWVLELVRKLQDSNCAAVCGLVLPAQLENSAEIAFEIYGGLGRGYADAAFGSEYLKARRWRPADTWRFGAGACMLIDGDLARELGGFDPDLGAGTPCACSEDTLLWYQMLRAGKSVHYTPRAIVHHFHRSSPEALRRQIFNYASGHAAYHARCFLNYGDYRSLLHLGYHLPTWFWKNYRRAARGKTKYPRTLIPVEALGTVHGAFTYPWLKLRRAARATLDRFRGRRATEPATRIASPLPAKIERPVLVEPIHIEPELLPHDADAEQKPVRAA